MSNDDVKDLIQIFMESGVAEMEVKRGENSIRLRRSFGSSAASDFLVPQGTQSTLTVSTGNASASANGGPAAAPSSDHIVKSPIVGTYYEAPKPGDAPFVRVGDQVEPGQVLCIIESMKLMNEIESEVAGTIAAKLMENGRAVEYGEALFAVRPR